MLLRLAVAVSQTVLVSDDDLNSFEEYSSGIGIEGPSVGICLLFF